MDLEGIRLSEMNQAEKEKKKKKKQSLEFLLWLSGLRTQLVSVRMQVHSLASLSGLRIWHCCQL